MSIETVEGGVVVNGAHFGLVVSRFNGFIVESLQSGAIDTLLRHGAEESDIGGRGVRQGTGSGESAHRGAGGIRCAHGGHH